MWQLSGLASSLHTPVVRTSGFATFWSTQPRGRTAKHPHINCVYEQDGVHGFSRRGVLFTGAAGLNLAHAAQTAASLVRFPAKELNNSYVLVCSSFSSTRYVLSYVHMYSVCVWHKFVRVRGLAFMYLPPSVWTWPSARAKPKFSQESQPHDLLWLSCAICQGDMPFWPAAVDHTRGPVCIAMLNLRAWLDGSCLLSYCFAGACW